MGKLLNEKIADLVMDEAKEEIEMLEFAKLLERY